MVRRERATLTLPLLFQFHHEVLDQELTMLLEQVRSRHALRPGKPLQGTYGFTIEEQKLAGPAPSGRSRVAITTFDGEGNLSQIDSVVIGGSLVAEFTHPPASGTYSVNADCTGTFTIEFRDGRQPVTVDFIVVDA
jgi:hypothetical protein